MAEDPTIAEASALDAVLFVETTTEIVAAYVSKNHVQPAEMPTLIATVHEALSGLGREAASEAPVAALKPPVPIRKTITDEHIISLEDGKPYKTLKRHLAALGMTPADYRTKWGLPADYPMVAPSFSAARSALAKEMGIGAWRRKG